jgi:hypothetical protein
MQLADTITHEHARENNTVMNTAVKLHELAYADGQVLYL